MLSSEWVPTRARQGTAAGQQTFVTIIPAQPRPFKCNSVRIPLAEYKQTITEEDADVATLLRRS
jgi:hypothetical protein